MRVLNGKGGKDRVTYLTPDATEILKKYLSKHNGSDYLFPSNRINSSITPRLVQRMVKRYAIKAGIEKDIHVHTFRHSAASGLLKKGMDLKAVSSLLGHASINTTGIYLHYGNGELKKAFDLANSPFSTNNGEPVKNEVVITKQDYDKLLGYLNKITQTQMKILKRLTM